MPQDVVGEQRVKAMLIKRLLLFVLLFLCAPNLWAQNPTSGGPIPQTTYTTTSNIGGGLPSGCTSPGTGAITCTGAIVTGSGASSAGATATGGFACTEAASTGWTATAGQDYQRCDSTLHTFVCSLNGAAEAACSNAALSGLNAATASKTIANGNNPITWNWAQTTDAQDAFAFGETSAATSGTLTSGLANQALLAVSTATNSTAAPLEVAQGSITNTVATPAAQFEMLWNNAGLSGRGLGIALTNTSSAVTSYPFFLNVGGTTAFGLDATGMVQFGSTPSITSNPPGSTLTTTQGWRYCLGNSGLTCVGYTGQGEFHMVNQGGNGWFEVSNGVSVNNAGGGAPDTGAGTSLSNGGIAGAMDGKDGTCSSFTPTAGHSYICTDSTAHEWLAATNGSSSSGMMVRSQPGAIHVTAQTATKTIYTLCAAAAGACNVAGEYRIVWYFNQGGTACGTPTPGQVTFALSWTDNAGAHSAIALPMNDDSSIAVFTAAFKFASTNTTGFASGEFNIWSTGAQPIQITNTYTACGVGTGTWELTATAERVQ